MEEASSRSPAATECTFADASPEAVEARLETCATVCGGLRQRRRRRLELTGGDRHELDDLANLTLELIGKAAHVDLARFDLALLGDRLFLAQPIGFDHGVAEYLDGAGHLADLVAAIGMRHGRV